MIILSPSILASDFGNLASEIEKVDKAGAQYIHLDIMDGSFVPNISFGPGVIKCVRKVTDRVFDVHFMIDEPIRYLEDYKAAGADFATVHVESCKHLHRTVTRIKELGMKAGVALNPATPLSALDYILDYVDMVLIMTVNPGFGGQAFIPETIGKIKDLKEMIDARNLDIDIQVDGGITLTNVEQVMNAGANIIVAGSSVYKGDPVANVKAFLDIFDKHNKC